MYIVLSFVVLVDPIVYMYFGQSVDKLKIVSSEREIFEASEL